MTRPRNGVYIWVTWLSRLMAGEANCQWAAWFRAHHTGYAKAPGDFQLASWTADHTQMLDEFSRERTGLGETVFREEQNSFNAARPSGLRVGGKPDVITFVPATGRYTVYDIKTGNPRQSDLIQVGLYMTFLPYSPGLYRGKKLDGFVVYRTARTPVPQQMLDAAFQKNVTHFLNILESASAPPKLPSHAGCAWCDLTTADCPDKVEGSMPNPDGQQPDFPL
jgi:hypothetical protein